MLKGTEAACINHPSVHAALRCKQCSSPVCDACVVPGPIGRYCSAVCKEKHEAFHQRVQKMDGKAGTASFTKVKTMITTLIVFLAVLFAVGFVASTVEIPIVSEITYRVRDMIGI